MRGVELTHSTWRMLGTIAAGVLIPGLAFVLYDDLTILEITVALLAGAISAATYSHNSTSAGDRNGS